MHLGCKGAGGDVPTEFVRDVGRIQIRELGLGSKLVQADSHSKKKHVDPTAAFNFEDDFLVETIHGRNDAIPTRKVGTDATAAIEVVNDDDVSAISSKMQDGLAAVGGIQVASGSTPPVISLTAEATPAGATGTEPVAKEGSPIPSVPGQVGSVNGRPGGK